MSRCSTRIACFVAGLALLAAAGCGKDTSGVGAYERELQAKENATNSLQSLGKMVQKNYPERPNEKGWAVDLSGKQLNDTIFQQLGTLGHIMELNLSKTNVADADMKRVNGLTNFCKILDLSHTEITDTGLDALKNQFILKELNLTGTKCTPGGVEALRKRYANGPIGKLNPTVKLK